LEKGGKVRHTIMVFAFAPIVALLLGLPHVERSQRCAPQQNTTGIRSQPSSVQNTFAGAKSIF
jgi:hypothetical protein